MLNKLTLGNLKHFRLCFLRGFVVVVIVVNTFQYFVESNNKIIIQCDCLLLL